ncbi:MAG: hypothetical protein ACKOYC_02610 [Bacteroidota bacterium]
MNEHQKIENVDVLKSKVPSEEIFMVPDGYFEDAKSNIHSRIKTPVIELPVWPRYMVAACITATVLVGTYFIADNSNDSGDLELSHDELSYCIQMEGLTQEMVTFHLTDDDLLSVQADEDQDAIQDYLIENQVDINHLTLD